jgi:hypothetical protein
VALKRFRDWLLWFVVEELSDVEGSGGRTKPTFEVDMLEAEALTL